MIYYTLREFKENYTLSLNEFLSTHEDFTEDDFLKYIKDKYFMYLQNVTLFYFGEVVETMGRINGVIVNEIEEKIFTDKVCDVELCKKYKVSFELILKYIDSKIKIEINTNYNYKENPDLLTGEVKQFIDELLQQFKYSHVYREMKSHSLITLTEAQFLSFINKWHPNIKLGKSRITSKLQVSNELERRIKEYKNKQKITN
jgi:hypothetical protein